MTIALAASVLCLCAAFLYLSWNVARIRDEVEIQSMDIFEVRDDVEGLEGRCRQLAEATAKHERMLAHMARMRAAKKAKSSKNSNKISRPAKKVAKTA